MGVQHRGRRGAGVVYDLVIKGVEMVVATHGRSIWILDDLTPLHQLYDLLKSKKRADAVHLFQPRPSVRMRVIGGFPGVAAQATSSRGPAWPGMISYGRTGTNIIRVLPLRQPDGSYENLLLDSGKNPPYGVVVQYYLAKPAKHAAERAVRHVDSGDFPPARQAREVYAALAAEADKLAARWRAIA